MDLKEKLEMLSRNGGFEQDLAGVSSTPHASDSIESDENSDSVEDFNLGALSIDNLYRSRSTPKKKSKNPSSEKPKAYTQFFDQVDESSSSEDDDFSSITKQASDLFSKIGLSQADAFDSFLEDTDFIDSEDSEMRDHLISMGRKYARDNATTKGSSEISKAFADSETRLRTLYDEVNKDKSSIEHDIERMRVPGRGGKILADMVSAKNSYHNTQLSIIKEINALKKTKFDLLAKEAERKKAAEAGSTDITSNTIQSIFSSSRSGIVGGIGGYGSSTSRDNDSNPIYIEPIEDDDEVIQRKYFSKQPSEESDGDKWLKYENSGVSYILIVDEGNNPVEVFAEDRDGNLITDFPLPDISNLVFDIDRTTRAATDNMQRNYQVRFE